jgi:GT2 family glycosyltransferase
MTVVVVTRNRRDQLLATLSRHRAPVVVVDNASSDGTPEAVEQAFPEVTLVRLNENAGAAARNEGVRLARTRYVAFADDDSYWAPGSLRRAARLLDAHPRTGLIAARVLVGFEERPDPVSVAMATAPLGRPAHLPGPAVLGFLACSVVVRREAFLSVGGFHPLLHLYGEEALLAMDLAAAGWGLAYVPSIVVHHHPGASIREPDRRRLLEVRNRVLTAWLRRPLRFALRETLRAVRDSADRPGAWAALSALRAALRERRRLPRAVEAAVRRLESQNVPR